MAFRKCLKNMKYQHFIHFNVLTELIYLCYKDMSLCIAYT